MNINVNKTLLPCICTNSYLLTNPKIPLFNILTKIGMFLLVLLVFTSCAPQSKGAYLERYKDFITEVSQDSETYSEQDWEKADGKYKLFNEDWNRKFESKLTWQDEIIIAKYQVQYNLIKVKRVSNTFFDEQAKSEYEQLKKQIKYYSENEMQDDIKSLMEFAKEMGDSSAPLIEKILKELDINSKDLENNK